VCFRGFYLLGRGTAGGQAARGISRHRGVKRIRRRLVLDKGSAIGSHGTGVVFSVYLWLSFGWHYNGH